VRKRSHSTTWLKFKREWAKEQIRTMDSMKINPGWRCTNELNLKKKIAEI